jgi:uncharacterized protein YecE (DUF72 family)
MPTPTLRIGTSGWHYAHWRGVFYPDEIPAGEYLAYYVRYFDTVEINNSFYQLPAESSLITWKNTVPPGFLFAVKASSYITHRKKLKEPAATTARFFDRIAALGEKLGPVLFQLPPRWRVNAARWTSFSLPCPAAFATLSSSVIRAGSIRRSRPSCVATTLPSAFMNSTGDFRPCW